MAFGGYMKLVRYQPTFFLQCTVLFFVVLASAGLFAIGNAIGSGTMCLASIGIGFILLFNVGMIASVILTFLTLGINDSKPVTSLWFTDIDETQKRQLTAFHEATKDNPTLR